MVEKRKEKEDAQRKSVEDVVDYINLSLINIMSKIEVVEHTDENGDLWYVKDLNDEQEKYHLEHMNKRAFKKYSPEMKIVDNRLHTKSFGTDINKLDKSSVEYKKGIDYALDAIKDLNDHRIYHGDILAGHDTANPDIHDRNIVYNGKEYRLIDFGPKTQKATFEGEVDKKRANNKNIPKPTIQLKVEDPVRWEQTLLEAYNKAHGLRVQAQKDSKKPPEMTRKIRKARPAKVRKRGFRGGPPKFSLSPKQPKKYEGSSPSSSGSDSPGSELGLSDFDWRHEEKGEVVKSLWGRGKKKRRRTKKKRRRKRKYTRRKKKRKRRRTKKKRRRRR